MGTTVNSASARWVSLCAVALFAISCSKDSIDSNPVAAPNREPAANAKTPAPTAKDSNTTNPLFDSPIRRLQGKQTTLGKYRGKALLIVNVASECGFTPQYEGLEKLYEKYRDKGLVVLGFPCNQFGGQEPGSEEEIAEFCKLNYGVSFPIFQKIEVNGSGRHPIYAQLVQHADADGASGDVKWNFEKFVVSADGKTVKRFRSGIKPMDDELIAAIEAALPSR